MKSAKYFAFLKVLLLGCFLLLFSSLGLSCGLTTSKITQDTSFSQDISLDAGQYMSIPVNLNSGDLIEGSFTVSGPTNLDIKFSIQDPAGGNAYGPVQSRSGTFTYRAQATGLYHLYIDNTYSLFTAKIVSLNFTCPKR